VWLNIKKQFEATSQHQSGILTSHPTSSAACVVRVEPHYSTVLEAALPNMHEVGEGIL
jgi:deferrochelatase/peroxidase EfeB